MASVTSLGLHRPTALQYLISEQLLPSDPTPDSYTWQVISNDNEQNNGDDELLITKTCVVWSSGGVVRKSFRFDVEKEEVRQALLTWFPEEGQHDSPKAKSKDITKDTTSSPPSTQTQKQPSKRRARALVVILKTQAHIYFLSGTSHVIHLPFEVESALSAPNGLILQRKLRVELPSATSLKIPRAPPNSFLSSQPQPWSAANSQNSTFSIADLGSPKPLPLPPPNLLGSILAPPTPKDDSNWPRLFSLTDPLAEMGLVVAPQDPGLHVASRPSTVGNATLSPSEEILYISQQNEFSSVSEGAQDNLVLALTLNRESSTYSVWRFNYIEPEPTTREKRSTSNGTVSRRRSRRSSFTGGTGATTPVRQSRQTDIIANVASFVEKEKEMGLTSDDQKVHFEASMDPDYQPGSIPRRKSRRVSSMLARADLSASEDHSVFTELATGHLATSRRGHSIGSQHMRNSFGQFAGPGAPITSGINFSASIGSVREDPVDNLLDELQAGGDFEGFHNMGLDDEDFEGLKQEVVFTKIGGISAEHSNVRFSSQNRPANAHTRVFTLSAPPCASDDPSKNTIVVCILDPDEKKLIVITLYTQKLGVRNGPVSRKKVNTSQKESTIVSWGNVVRAKQVLDACKITDGAIERILVLTETSDGFGEMTLQAPWSILMKIRMPGKLAVSNSRNLHHDRIPIARSEGGPRRVLSKGPRCLRQLRNQQAHGRVDIDDGEGTLHQIRISMEPLNPQVSKVLRVCQAVLPGTRAGEGLLVGWWYARTWLQESDLQVEDPEWSALLIILFTSALGLDPSSNSSGSRLALRQRKSRKAFVRSSSGAADTGCWEAMLEMETSASNPISSWMKNSGWSWIADQLEDEIVASKSSQSTEGQPAQDTNNFIKNHVTMARDFIKSPSGHICAGASGFLPTCGTRHERARHLALVDIMVGIHLLREEQKLDVTTSDSVLGMQSLGPPLLQLAKWLSFDSWVRYYYNDEASMDAWAFDASEIVDPHGVLEYMDPPSIYDWIHQCIIQRQSSPFMTIADVAARNSPSGNTMGSPIESWSDLTRRTLLLGNFLQKLKVHTSSIQFIENILFAGVDTSILDTLPEAVAAPLREAMLDCQTQPPTTWGEELLDLVGRDDVNMLLSLNQRKKTLNSSVMAPTHIAGADTNFICMTTNEVDNIGSFDGSAEVDRQAITRLIFKDDQRFSEAAKILNTSKATIARVVAEPRWNESELLEAEKEHVQMLAMRTLAVPSGRGLLYFSARVPLLTEKFPIGGFNLHCIMKSSGNTVGVEKTVFTEEKVCWAFFHSGVSAGLSVSRAARGIDTSWILYNKPAELSNRHAGFLLALGLNGHLRQVAKWVAFKYLTPKHTMTSIGLLLGLAASFLGTMDSLVTRLLSVHVTRMLPPGAAELNLSPLTQTTGIMGIGLLYCDTQHRRMSEIMMSEIEQIDPELEDEPLRNEGYRLAAGFSLGLINLGKGSDLKGLHDMRLTERLLGLAVVTKKVDLVHILDKASSAAVVAIALIFMKSEDQAVARKIDVPASLLQFDYIRPDVFILRTIAKHIIMWSKIEASMPWIKNNLPTAYQGRSSLEEIYYLTGEDLPLYDIIAGLCFSIALRFAGSGSEQARDVLIHYLDEMMRICNLPVENYDQRLSRTTVRNCQDMIALAASIVMAGTGDLIVFRRLRSMHGRDDSETPYGSHLAAHLAIGALFLGGGTHTFGTSNLAIASLIIAFYPIFPSTILDNKSHLQAFRHFWVLATESRCLVARDVDTNQPISIPLSITLRAGDSFNRNAPCLLPELTSIRTVGTSSPEYWDVVLDFANNPTHIAAFQSMQVIFVRRRPSNDSTSFHIPHSHQISNTSQPLSWLFELPALKGLTPAERALVLPADNAGYVSRGTEGTVVDARLVLERALQSGKRDRLVGLKLLFDWAKSMEIEGRGLRWIRREVVEGLEAQVWIAGMEQGASL